MRKVSSEEIKKLYQFTRKHYVEYYDLQTELVDHLANGMEEHWRENPNLSFDENLKLEFKKFGVFGFSDVVAKRKSAMEKKYWKLVGKEIKLELIKPKTLFFVLLFMVASVFTIQFVSPHWAFYGLMFLLLIISAVFFFKISAKNRKRRKNKKKIYLLEEIIMKAEGSNYIFIFPVIFLNTISEVAETYDFGLYLSLFLGVLVSVFALMAYVTLIVLPKKKEDILKKAYPEREFID